MRAALRPQRQFSWNRVPQLLDPRAKHVLHEFIDFGVWQVFGHTRGRRQPRLGQVRTASRNGCQLVEGVERDRYPLRRMIILGIGCRAHLNGAVVDGHV